MIKYGLGTVPYDESASACDGVGSRIGHRRKIRLLPPCCHLIPSAGGDALPRVRRSMSTRFFHLPFLDVPRRIARERVPPMGVVKRGLWAQRLFHFFNATESRYLR